MDLPVSGGHLAPCCHLSLMPKIMELFPWPAVLPEELELPVPACFSSLEFLLNLQELFSLFQVGFSPFVELHWTLFNSPLFPLDCVLGGMTTFLFINVTISGMKILTMGEGITRRNRFIAALALGLGIGVELIPEFFNIDGQAALYPREGNFWPIKEGWSSGYKGMCNHLPVIVLVWNKWNAKIVQVSEMHSLLWCLLDFLLEDLLLCWQILLFLMTVRWRLVMVVLIPLAQMTSKWTFWV